VASKFVFSNIADIHCHETRRKHSRTRLVAFSKHIYIRENCRNIAKIKENPNASLNPKPKKVCSQENKKHKRIMERKSWTLPSLTHSLNIFLKIFSAKIFNVFILGLNQNKKHKIKQTF